MLEAHNATVARTGSVTGQEQAGAAASATASVSGGLGPLPAGWEVRHTLGGQPYYVDHSTRTMTWVNRCRQAVFRVMGPNGQNSSLQPQTTLQPRPPPPWTGDAPGIYGSGVFCG